MASHFFQNTTAYVVSIGLHATLLLFLLINVQRAIIPKPAPVIRATVHFEQPVVKKRSKPLKRTATKKRVAKSKPRPLVKPKIKSLGQLQFDANLQTGETEQFTGNNQLKTLGFLRANDFTKKKSTSEPAEVRFDRKSSLVDTPRLTKKLTLTPVAPGVIPQKSVRIKSDPKPTTPPPKEAPTFDIDIGQLTTNESVFSKKWKKQLDTKTHRKSLAYKISSNWAVPPISLSDFEVVLEAHIDKKGRITQYGFVKKADLAILNIAAERAVKLSEPFDSLPGLLREGQETYRVVFRFTPDKAAN